MPLCRRREVVVPTGHISALSVHAGLIGPPLSFILLWPQENNILLYYCSRPSFCLFPFPTLYFSSLYPLFITVLHIS